MTFLLISADRIQMIDAKEKWYGIETKLTRNDPTDQFVKYFEKHKNAAIEFKLTKFARKRACLKRDYWQNIIEWQNHLVKEEIRSRNKKVKTSSLIDAIETMKACTYECPKMRAKLYIKKHHIYCHHRANSL